MNGSQLDLHQLRTFVAVARAGSITRAADIVHLSQPAASAHIKEMEDTLGLALFERTSRGMSLTADGRRLLAKAERTLSAHQELLAEAARSSSGALTGKLRLGAGSSSSREAVGHLLVTMAERFPLVEVTFRHARSADVLAGLRNDTLDAGVYNEGGEPDPDLATIEVSRFKILLTAAKGGRSPPARGSTRRRPRAAAAPPRASSGSAGFGRCGSSASTSRPAGPGPAPGAR